MTIRPARAADRDQVFALARDLATSFTVRPEAFEASFTALLAQDSVHLLVAEDGPAILGYLLGFRHLTFYANGPVGWVEELMVAPDVRGGGIGAALMAAFEQWAARSGCALVAISTRRAAPFYQAIGYEESATYFRKLL